MPIYEFKCNKCGSTFEELVKHSVESYPCKCGYMAKKLISRSNWSINGECYNPTPPLDDKQKEMESKGYVYKNGYYIRETNNKVVYDLYCNECDYTESDVWLYQDQEPTQSCPHCNIQLKKQIAMGSYKLEYDPKKDICDWSGNTSQYWKDVREERRKGRKVKAINEN